ncbi:MAG: DUF4878 domain-containing protein [Ktedonobacterales bacterium]|nr:DUF4878 domain-containing protein [Ktedonobacterales bacterium]
MAHPRRPLNSEADPSASLLANRPKSRLPQGYSPNSTLPPGYLPPTRDWQRTGAMAREADRPALTRRQIVTLAIGGAGLVALIALVATLVISTLVVQNSLNGATTTIDTFYSALRAGDDVQAYSQLSPTYRASIPQATFGAQFHQLDVLNGPIANFTVNQQNTSGANGTAVVSVARSGNHSQVQVDTLALVQVNGTWYIDRITSRQQPVVTTPTPES